MPKPLFQAAAEGLPSRRQFLCKLAAASAAGSVIGVTAFAAGRSPDPHPDAKLLALGREFEAAWASERKADDDVVASRFSPASCEQCDRAGNATRHIVLQIEKEPARTLEGLGVKAMAISWCHGGEPIEDDEFSNELTTNIRLATSIVRDLLSIERASV